MGYFLRQGKPSLYASQYLGRTWLILKTIFHITTNKNRRLFEGLLFSIINLVV